MKVYRRLTETDRENILVYLQQGNNQGLIAAMLVFFLQSAISRELSKGYDRNTYNPIQAQRESKIRSTTRIRQLKINKEVWKVIENHLSIHWSPFQIADFIHNSRKDDTVVPVSEKTIYNHLHFHMKGELQKLALQELHQKGKQRKKTGEDNRGKLPNMTLIDDRPIEINERRVPGHWEGDLIIGKDHKPALNVIVERQTRYVLIDRLERYTARDVRKSIKKRLRKISPDLLGSITCDQGKEMAEHELLAQNIKMKVYFCHPQSPWEKRHMRQHKLSDLRYA